MVRRVLSFPLKTRSPPAAALKVNAPPGACIKPITSKLSADIPPPTCSREVGLATPTPTFPFKTTKVEPPTEKALPVTVIEEAVTPEEKMAEDAVIP